MFTNIKPESPDLRKNGILILLSITERPILSAPQQHRPNITQPYTESIKSSYFSLQSYGNVPYRNHLSEQNLASESCFCQAEKGRMVLAG